MSMCKELSTAGRKRRHLYEEGNKCAKCGHITKHGSRFRKAALMPQK